MTVPLGESIPLILVADLGLASVHNWAEDYRVDEDHLAKPNSFETKRWRCTTMLVQHYTTTPVLTSLKTLLLPDIFDAGAYTHVRPLNYVDLNEYERDMSCVLSSFYHYGKASERNNNRTNVFCRVMWQLAERALQLLTDMRPKNVEAQVAFVSHLVAKQPRYSSWLGEPDSTRPVVNRCRVPTHQEARRINRDLIACLNQEGAASYIIEKSSIYSRSRCFRCPRPPPRPCPRRNLLRRPHLPRRYNHRPPPRRWRRNQPSAPSNPALLEIAHGAGIRR